MAARAAPAGSVVVPVCKGCGAPIIWARTAKNNKPIPLDPKPKRMIQLEQRDGELFEPIASVVQVYEPHHGTCPKADDFRKRGGS